MINFSQSPFVLFCTASECRLEQRYSWRQYWNYLRRQLFVLDTYATPHNRALNLVMAAVHVWASASAAAPVLAGAWVSACPEPSHHGGGACVGLLGRCRTGAGRCLGRRRLRGTGQAGEGGTERSRYGDTSAGIGGMSSAAVQEREVNTAVLLADFVHARPPMPSHLCSRYEGPATAQLLLSRGLCAVHRAASIVGLGVGGRY